MALEEGYQPTETTEMFTLGEVLRWVMELSPSQVERFSTEGAEDLKTDPVKTLFPAGSSASSQEHLERAMTLCVWRVVGLEDASTLVCGVHVSVWGVVIFLGHSTGFSKKVPLLLCN